MWKYLLAWIPMVLIAIANGTLREVWYGKRLSELRAHQVSTLCGMLLLGLYIWGLMRLWSPDSPQQALGIGLMWLGLTVAFECLFGHYMAGHAWSRIFHDYNMLAGRVWLVLLIWVTIAPYVFYRIQQK